MFRSCLSLSKHGVLFFSSLLEHSANGATARGRGLAARFLRSKGLPLHPRLSDTRPRLDIDTRRREGIQSAGNAGSSLTGHMDVTWFLRGGAKTKIERHQGIPVGLAGSRHRPSQKELTPRVTRAGTRPQSRGSPPITRPLDETVWFLCAQRAKTRWEPPGSGERPRRSWLIGPTGGCG